MNKYRITMEATSGEQLIYECKAYFVEGGCLRMHFESKVPEAIYIPLDKLMNIIVEKI